jgi:hypothetical protein
MTKAADKKSRCNYRAACGRRCRKAVSPPESRFCELHQPYANAEAEPDLSADLTDGLEEFSSPAAINEFLSRLLVLLSESRISPRRAAVLAYITNQILRTIALREHQAAVAQNPKNRRVRVLWTVPGPPGEPQLEMAPSVTAPPATPKTSGAPPDAAPARSGA